MSEAWTGGRAVEEPRLRVAAIGPESAVTWTLTATRTGTLLRLEHAGFRSDQAQAFGGAHEVLPKLQEALGQGG